MELQEKKLREKELAEKKLQEKQLQKFVILLSYFESASSLATGEGSCAFLLV
jgi:hypothetical protein